MNAPQDDFAEHLAALCSEAAIRGKLHIAAHGDMKAHYEHVSRCLGDMYEENMAPADVPIQQAQQALRACTGDNPQRTDFLNAAMHCLIALALIEGK